MDHAAENIVDGALYNSGQSCCAIERVYVHEKLYEAFVKKCVSIVIGYQLGNPFDSKLTNLGPVVHVSAANRIRAQVQDARIESYCILVNFY